MFTITASTFIRRSPELVFAFAGDYLKDPQWRQGVVAMTYETVVRPAVGVRTRETMRSLAGTTVTLGEITAFSPTRTAFRSVSGPVPCEGWRCFAAESGGTRFTYSLSLRPVGLFRLLEPLLRFVMARQVRGDLERLGAHLADRAEHRPAADHVAVTAAGGH